MLGMDDPMSAVIARLYDPAKIQVRVDVPLADAAAIAVGQPCEVIVDVLPGVALRGEVTRVLHFADIQKNTLQAKVAILNPRPELRPEMLARVRFLEFDAPQAAGDDATASRTALHAPAAAITNGQAWLVTEFDGKHGVARQRAIEAGPEQSGWVEVASGLNPGDLLVTRSTATLEEGARVRLRPATKGASDAIH
jgi:multidrug efflux pump subunit AcrA (membrane-fusion protein)